MLADIGYFFNIPKNKIEKSKFIALQKGFETDFRV